MPSGPFSDLSGPDERNLLSYRSPEGPPLVYARCMARTNIDIDEEACRVVMERFQLKSKREAVNFALHSVAGEPLSVERARALKGSGWEGDLEDIRAHRPVGPKAAGRAK